MKKFALFLLLLCGSISFFFWPSTKRSIKRVILLSVDTLRADYLGCYNPRMATSPHIDKFAAENILFKDALSQAANTAISHKSIFYSVYPHVHKTSTESVPEETLVSPIEVVKRNGFRTAAFVGGGQLRPIFGFSRGFQSYEITDLRQLEKKSFRWLEENADHKFFLFLHTYRVHCPYTPPAPYRQKYAGWYKGSLDPAATCSLSSSKNKIQGGDLRFVRSLYAANVQVVDDFFGRLREKLTQLGIYDDTMLVFLSDHGESLGEADYIGHNRLRDVELKIPLILRVPGSGTRIIDSPVQAIDVMPTIFSALQIKTPYVFEGSDLLFNTDTAPRNDVRFAEIWNEVYVRKGSHSLLFWKNEPGSAQFFDVSQDPEERYDLSENNQALVGELSQYHAALVRNDMALSAKFVINSESRPKADEETVENLRALGYVQ